MPSATIIRDNITYSTELTLEACCECSVPFAIPQDMYKRARSDPSVWFWCPNGHKQHYLGETEEDRLKRELRNTKSLLRSERDAYQGERRRRIDAQRSASAYKGVATRMRNQAGRGTCPVDECGQDVPQLKEHMESEHPTWVDEPVTDK